MNVNVPIALYTFAYFTREIINVNFANINSLVVNYFITVCKSRPLIPAKSSGKGISLYAACNYLNQEATLIMAKHDLFLARHFSPFYALFLFTSDMLIGMRFLCTIL